MPRLHSIFFFFAVTSLVLVGCNTQSHLGGDDAGADSATDGGGGTCGSVTCGEGLECCNASCGVCAPPGLACVAIECEDGGTPPPPTDGGPDETCGPVTCGEGTTCCNASCGICAAPGVVCTAILCEDAGPPPPMGCGGIGGFACPDGMFCEHSEGCGFDDGTGTCQPMPGGCTADCPGVCGCDGMTYCNSCMAAGSGVSVMHSGACDVGLCSPLLDARGVGDCRAFFGYGWNGETCVGISGCECVGPDCGSLTSLEVCEATHADCPIVIRPAPGAACGGVLGASCLAGEYCDYPDGSYCGGDDSLGVCTARPDPGCPEIYSPVCGCDVVTYDNGCFANAAGQDILHVGGC